MIIIGSITISIAPLNTPPIESIIFATAFPNDVTSEVVSADAVAVAVVVAEFASAVSDTALIMVSVAYVCICFMATDEYMLLFPTVVMNCC